MKRGHQCKQKIPDIFIVKDGHPRVHISIYTNDKNY